MKKSHVLFAVLAALGPAARAQTVAVEAEPRHAPRDFRVAELAGHALASYPWFAHVADFVVGSEVSAAVDPARFPDLAGRLVRLYVTEHRAAEEWLASRALVDVRGSSEDQFVSAGGVMDNVFVLDRGTFSADGGLALGRGYDVVLDADGDGRLGPGDVIDGFGKEAGFYVVIRSELRGPLAVREVLYSGGSWLQQDLYYPTEIASLGEVPLVVVSHGNGHQYTWYDHIGYHLASYGFVVMSHANQTGPGIETASTTTLTNTDYLLGHLDTIDGGALLGHVDPHRIVWIGHSRGGEGVARAYDRLHDGAYTPTSFTIDDIVLVSSIAPTDFLGPDGANPHEANFHLWVGGADKDVTGCASCEICQSFHLLQRATGNRQSISLHGVGHGAFHAGTGDVVGVGGCLLTRAETHVIMLGYLLPLVRMYTHGDPAANEFLWRQWEDFQLVGTPTNPCVAVDLMYERRASARRFVIDDFETQVDPHWSSSGASVSYDVENLVEGRSDDGNASFTADDLDPMNGMTGDGIADSNRAVVFEWNGADASVAFEVGPSHPDLAGYVFLSFRAAQSTRHAYTRAELGDLVFTVELADRAGRTSAIRIDAYGGGIEEPFDRAGCGDGRGWGNEFETVRIRLDDFARDGSNLDLGEIASVTFRFGPSHGSPLGRIGLDDVELVSE